MGKQEYIMLSEIIWPQTGMWCGKNLTCMWNLKQLMAWRLRGKGGPWRLGQAGQGTPMNEYYAAIQSKKLLLYKMTRGKDSILHISEV